MPQHCHTATVSPSRAINEDERPSPSAKKKKLVGRTCVREGSTSKHSACASGSRGGETAEMDLANNPQRAFGSGGAVCRCSVHFFLLHHRGC